jgi:hypothetical protein
LELTDAEVALVIDALEDAAFYRDTRSRVLDTAVRRQRRRSSLPAESAVSEQDVHREKARDYAALAVRLKSGRRR